MFRTSSTWYDASPAAHNDVTSQSDVQQTTSYQAPHCQQTIHILTISPNVNIMFAILGSFHTTPEKFENAALFPRLGLPSTLNRHEIGAFQIRSLNRRNLKTPAFRFRVDGKHFEN